jgi:CheY-like chemotaxis protein
VLVVDDHEPSAIALARLIRLYGYDVKVARDGLEALGSLKTFDPDLVLLDLTLPYMDGYEVARRIRADERHCAVLLVALTGYDSEADRARARELGFDEYLAKPVNAAALCTLLVTGRNDDRT